MSGFTCHLLDREQHRAADDRRMELAKTRLDGKQGAGLHEVVEPCAMWFAYWYFEPGNPEHVIRREKALAMIADGSFSEGKNRNYYLSRFYWQQWSHVRAPICVLCPNGREWCVDAKSSNGEGWQVKGDAPRLVVTPSIDVPGYHGWLGSGFPDGVERPGVFTPGIA